MSLKAFKDKLISGLLQRTERILIEAQKPSVAIEKFLFPRPVDVIRERLHIDLESEDLELLAMQFCADYDRELLPHLIVHDAVHFLLRLPPTQEGERKVVLWQYQHGCFDSNPMGLVDVLMAAAVIEGHGVIPFVAVNIYEQILKKRDELFAALPKRILEARMVEPR
jgi:hypothetical protein